MTQILVWKSKYGDQYYDAATPESLERSARAIVATLVKDGWIYEPDEPSFTPEEVEARDLTEEQLAALPEFARERAVALRKAVAARQAYAQEERADFDLASALAKGESPLMAFRTRRGHRDDEWRETVEALLHRFPDAVAEGNTVYRPATAWALLQQRDGAEYEDYTLATVRVIAG